MSKRRGYAKVASLNGSPVLIHWTFPVGGLAVAISSHQDKSQWLYYCLAYTSLILVHELGHFLAARWFQLKVYAIEIAGYGGLCRIDRPKEVYQGVVVYSAGVLAQLMIFLLTLIFIQLFEYPISALGHAIVTTFTYVNVILILFNLIPHSRALGPMSDGYVLWKLFLHKYRGQPHPLPPVTVASAEESPVFPPETHLLTKPGFQPLVFVHGIEILNDKTTPMEFVVNILQRHLNINRNEAILKMLDIHNKGGMLFALPTLEDAQQVADAITAESRSAGHVFVCRAVSSPEVYSNG